MVGDVFEANRRHFNWQAINLAHTLHTVGDGEGDGDLAAHALVLVQVVNEQQDDMVRIHKIPVLIVETDAVGIAVCGKAYFQLRRML